MSYKKDFKISTKGVLKQYVGNGGDVVIPEGVIEIGEFAFKDCKTVTSIEIPNTVIKIRESAFLGCKSLTAITVPNSILEIGCFAFDKCPKLADEDGFIIANNVLYRYIGKNETVFIPDSVTKIESFAFYNCKTAINITLPESVIEIGESVFYECSKMESISLSNNLKSIGDQAFCKCRKLQSISLPHGLEYIGMGVFWDCWSIQDVQIPQSVKQMYGIPFWDCRNIRTIDIPDNVELVQKDKDTIVPAKGVSCETCSYVNTVILPSVLKNCNVRFTLGCLVFLVCPGLKYEYIDEKNRLAAVYGFIKYNDRFVDDEVIDSYKDYLFKQRKNLLPWIWEYDAVGVIHILAKNGKITAKNFEEEYFNPAVAATATECVKFLLDWKNNNISVEDIQKAEDQKIKRELEKDPYNVADMKKLWSYKKLEDGTLEITSYKGNETIVEIPPRIGKNAVSKIGRYAMDFDYTNGGNIMGAGRSYERKRALDRIERIVIPDGVKEIEYMAFGGLYGLNTVFMPSSIKMIEGNPFYHSPYSSSFNTPPRPPKAKLTIHAPADSYAEKFAKANKILFVAE